jgi:hypothetical protein
MLLARFLYIWTGVIRWSQGQSPKIFPLLSACSPRTLINTCLLISLIFFLLSAPTPFILHAMESCFVVPFPFQEATILLRFGRPAIFVSFQPGAFCTSYYVRILYRLSPVFSVFFFLHTCVHCAAVLVIEPNSCLDGYETWAQRWTPEQRSC